MILQILFSIVFSVVNVFFLFLPAGNELPWGLDSIFIQAVGYYNAVATFFPPFVLLLQYTLYYMVFLGLLLILRLVFGTRGTFN